jgi:hypothetical protein
LFLNAKQVKHDVWYPSVSTYNNAIARLSFGPVFAYTPNLSSCLVDASFVAACDLRGRRKPGKSKLIIPPVVAVVDVDAVVGDDDLEEIAKDDNVDVFSVGKN